uniref:Large polyvalent protein associated domain-containing protein n=1 Tax=viral metagenome TaxID=1070528 RepID=A0A6H1ZIT9_9ZZZZ
MTLAYKPIPSKIKSVIEGYGLKSLLTPPAEKKVPGDKIYSSEEAKELGLDIAKNWRVKIGYTEDMTPEIKSFYSPEGKWWSPDEIFTLESGEWITKPEYEASQKEYESYLERQRVYQEELGLLEPFKTEGDKYDVSAALKGGVSEDILTKYFGEDILKRPAVAEISTDRIQQLLGQIYPEEELLASTDTILNWLAESDNNIQQFLGDIQEAGRTPETEELVKILFPDATEVELDNLFGVTLATPEERITEWWTLDYWKQNFLIPYGGEDLAGKAAASFVAGIGDTLNTAGGAARWLGYEDVGTTLSSIGVNLQNVAPPTDFDEFQFADLADPEYWATKITRAIPFTLSLLPLAVGGYTGGAAVATSMGLGTIGKAILGGLAGAALSRPMESALEAGQQYDDAIARGKTEKEAKEEANEVFRNNMTLAGADAWEIAIALAPTPKWVPTALVKSGLVRTVRIGGKMVIVGLSEGGEELYQDMIQRHARGEEWQLDPISKEVFAIGAVMGVGMGLGGDVISSVINKSKPALPSELSKRFDSFVGDFKAQGFSQAEAEIRALDKIVQVPEAKEIVIDKIKEVKEEQLKLELPETEISKPRIEVRKPIKEVPTEIITPRNAVRRVAEKVQFEQPKTGLIEKAKQSWHSFQTKMVDDLYALKKFTQVAQKGGVELSVEENPYIQARLSKGISSKATTFLEQGTFGKKFWKVKGKKAVPNYTGESLENILQEVKDNWQDFSTYLVSRRAVELNAREIKTGISIEEAQAAINELERKHKNFSNLADRVYKYQDNLLVYAREMGLISEDLLGKLRKYGNYVPFYRVFNELQAKGFMGKKMADIASPIKRIKGSEREIINPLESIVKNTYVIISAADRNNVGIMMANLVDQNPELVDLFERVNTPIARVARVNAKELGVEVEGLSDEDTEQIVDIFRPSFFVRGDEVTVLIDGKKKYYRIDPDLRDALLNLDRESMGMLGKILSLPAKWLRAGATLSPDFMIRNPARDQMTSFVYSNYGFLPGIDFLRGIAGLISKDADYQLFRTSGAEHSMLVSMDREYLQKTFKEVVRGKKFTSYIKHPLELFQIVSELGEKATRLGEFKRGLARGVTPQEAGYSARNVSLDFAQAGTSAHALNRIIAFFNANIRGWAKMMSSFKEHPIRTSAKVFMGITLPSILLYYANRDDPRWKEIPQWQKDLFWIVMTDDNIFRIPKPFELGIIFGSIPERFLEWLDNQNPDMMKDVLLNVAEAGSPGFIPTAILPIIENMTNYSFFRGRAIVPASREKMPPELQYTDYTGEVSRKLGELLKYPPAKIENLIYGWTGGLGRYATDILGAILKGTGISPSIPEPSPTLADIPVIKAFVVRNPYGSSGETVDRFYKTLEKYEEGEKYLKEMLELNNQQKFEEYKSKHPELLFFYEFPEDPEKEGVFYSASARYLRRVARDLSGLGKKQDEVYNSMTLTPAEKRKLVDEIDKLKTEISRRALDLFIGGEPQILQFQLSEAENRLGELIDDVPILSLDEPNTYDMRKLSADYNNLLEAVKIKDIEGMKNIPKTAFAWLEKEESEKIQLSFVNTPIYKIDTDKELNLLTKRQRELFLEYNSLSDKDKDAFLKKHPELEVNPREEWLIANPIDNARLAVWGQAKIMTREAYNEAKRLIKALDIPDSAMPDFSLPPEGSIENYFEYQDIVAEFSANSWEAQLLMAQDNDLREWLDREPIETPIPALELQVKHRDLFDLVDSYGDKDSPNYILDDKEREEAIKKLKADNPDWVDDIRRIEAIESNGQDFAEKWVERGQKVDEFSAGSSEAMVWLLDNPDVHKWALEQELLTDDGSDWNEPVLRINAKWRKEDEEYDALKTTEEREAYLAKNELYRLDRRRRDAYNLEGIQGEKFTEGQIENYVQYYELETRGYRQERYLIDNPEFAEIWSKITGNKLPDPDKIPLSQYDDLLEKANPTKDDERRMDAYKLFVPKSWKDAKLPVPSNKNIQGYVKEYVEYYSMEIKGYDQERWLQEHQDYYNNVWLKILGYQEIDFDKIPSERFEQTYNNTYLNLDKGAARYNFRLENPWFDEEGVKLGKWKPAEAKEVKEEVPTKAEAELSNIQILQDKYGFSEEQARSLIGTTDPGFVYIPEKKMIRTIDELASLIERLLAKWDVATVYQEIIDTAYFQKYQ